MATISTNQTVTRQFLELIIVFLLFSCRQNATRQSQIINAVNQKQTDSLKNVDREEWFSNLNEVTSDTTSTCWGNYANHYTSVLHFSVKHKDTVFIEYHGQYWYSYPLKIKDNTIVIFWDDNMDCKFEIGFEKPIKGITKPIKGEPFAFLTLKRDTLFAEYIQKAWTKEFNKRDTSLTIFPDYFVARRLD